MPSRKIVTFKDLPSEFIICSLKSLKLARVFPSTVKKTSPICNPASEAADSGSIASIIGFRR